MTMIEKICPADIYRPYVMRSEWIKTIKREAVEMRKKTQNARIHSFGVGFSATGVVLRMFP